MFEKFVQKLLLDYLGRYVKDIQKDQLKTRYWDGEVLLENVELILEAFDYLQLPFALKEGRVGKLSIKIPWKKLGWDPIIIVLEDVYICAGQREDHEWSSESVEKREYAAKKAKLAAAELAKLSRRVCENQAGQSFISYITAKILDGIQISIRNVHVKYTDKQNDSAQFVFGLKFSSVTMKQNPIGSSIGRPRGGQVNKIVEVSGIAIYCSTGNRTLHSNGDDYGDGCGDLLCCNARGEPFDVAVSLQVNRSGKLENSSPQYSISVDLTDLVLLLNEIQMRHILVLWDYLCTCHLREKYGRFRPWYRPLSKKTKGWQKVWWHYAQESVLLDVRQKLKKTSWRYLGWRMSYRRRYVSLYKRKLDILRQEQPVDKDILQELEQMERESDIDDILSYRSIAEQELQETHFSSSSSNGMKNVVNIALERQSNDEGSSVRTRGWLNWLSLGMLGAEGTDDSIQFSGAVSDEVVKDIYEATEFHPEFSIEGGLSAKSRIYLSSIKFNVHQITAKLQNKTHGRDIGKFVFEEVFVECKLWEESWNILFLVNSVELDDPYTSQVILCTKKGIIEDNALLSVQPFATLEVDKSQINLDPGLSLKLVLQPVDITYDSGFLLNLWEFYHILESFQFQNERVLFSLNRFENVDTRLVSKAEFVLSKRTKIIWDVQFSCIIIKVPWRRKDTELFFMVLKLGSFILNSSSETRSLGLESESQSEFTNFIHPKSISSRPNVLQLGDLYDHYDISVTNFEVNVIVPDSNKAISVFEKFSSSIFLASCVIQNEPTLKPLVISLSVATLSVYFSPFVYGILVGVIASLDNSKSNSEISFEAKKDALSSFQLSLTANVDFVRFHVDLTDDLKSRIILILALRKLGILYSSEDNARCTVSIKSFKMNTDASAGLSCETLCSSQNFDVMDSIHPGSESAERCFFLHYQAERSPGIVFHQYAICLDDVDIHFYPNIFGLLLKFCEKISAYGTSPVPICRKSGITKEMKDSILISGLGVPYFGFSNFHDAESIASTGVTLDDFPFLTVHDSGSPHSPRWRKSFNVRDGKFVKSPNANNKRPDMFGTPTFKLSSPASRDCHNLDLLVIDLNLTGVKAHFHGSSCVIGTATLPICKSLVIVDHVDCVDMLCSIEGLLLCSPWPKFLWANLVPNLSPILNIRFRKENDGSLNPASKMSFGIQHSYCVLPSEFLAMLIGYFSLPDWTSDTTEHLDIGNHMEEDMRNNSSCIAYTFELLDSALLVPVESNDRRFLHLDLQQLYGSFTSRCYSHDACKYIPPECTVPAQKVADLLNVLNVFGRDIFLSLVLLGDNEQVPLNLDMDMGGRSISLIAPLDADVWIRIPSESQGFSTCIMLKAYNCEVTAEDGYFVSGVEALEDVINQLSLIGQKSDGFRAGGFQFMQLNRSSKQDIVFSPDASSVTLLEVRCSVNSLTVKLFHSLLSLSISPEAVAKADMQLNVSVSLRNEKPLYLDVGFSRLILHSLNSSVILVQCASEGSISNVLHVHLARLDQGVNELLVSLPCAHIWLHLSDWNKVIDNLHSYSRKSATDSFMVSSLDNSHSFPIESLPNEIPVVKNDSESSTVSNFNMDSSVNLILKSEKIGISVHFPVVVENNAFDRLMEAEAKHEIPSYFSSTRQGEQTMILAKDSEYVAVILETGDCELIISGRHADLKFSVDKVKGMLESIKDHRLLSWPFFQLFHVHAQISLEQQNLHTCIEFQNDSLDVWLSFHLLYFWHSLVYEIPETESSQLPLFNVDLTVKLRKASLLLTDGRWSCNGPLIEIRLRNLCLNTVTTESTMEVSIAGGILVNYNNIQKVMWEPFLETWSFQLCMSRKYKQSAFPKTSTVTDINLTSQVPLNLNFTEPVIEVIFRVCELIKEVWEHAGLKDSPENQLFSSRQTTESVYTGRYAPYIVQNETSLPLSFQVYRGMVNADDIDILSVKEGSVVRPGSYVPIYIDETVEEQVLRFRPTQSLDRLNEKKLNGVSHYMISFQIEGTSEFSVPVSMDMVGLSYFEVNFSEASGEVEVGKNEYSSNSWKMEEKRITNPHNGFFLPVVLDVSIQRYSKLIRLYSTVKLLNATSVPLELRFDIPFGVSPKVVDPIYPGQEFPLPLLLAEAGLLRWRPLGNDFVWSEAHPLSNILPQENMPGFVRSFVCYPTHPSSDLFRCCISVQHIKLPSSISQNKGSSNHVKETASEAVEAFGEGLYFLEKPRKPCIHYVTLTTPLLVRNYLPLKLSLSIESGGVTRTVTISEVDSASIFHIDSTHDLGLVFHVLGYNPAALRFPRAETFTTVARLHETRFSQSETLTLYPDSSHGPVYVNIEKVMDAFCGARELCIFSPFLLYNCSGLPLTVADYGNEMSINGCYMPSCYYSIEMDQVLGNKHGLSLVSPKQNSHLSTDDVWNSFAKISPISLRKEINLHLPSPPSRCYVATDSSTRSLHNSDNHEREAKEASLNILKCANASQQYSDMGVDRPELLNLDSRKVKACMYSPQSTSSASELMVRLSLCHPEFIIEKTKDFLWSSPFLLVPESGSTSVIVPQALASGAFIISVTSNPLAGPFSGRTRAITFQPRYVICNACSKDLCYKQKGTDSVFQLGVGKHSHLFWADTTRELLVSLRFNEPGCLWSGSFFPDHLGDTQVKMRNYVYGSLNMIRVEVQSADVSGRDEKIVGSANGNSGTHLILLSDDNTGFMPYRIDNFSKERLRIYQQKCESFETTVHSYTTCPYAWDEPCYPHRLVVEALGERILGSYALDDVKEQRPVYLASTSEKPGRQLFISIHAEGTIKVLSVIDSSCHLLKDPKESVSAGIGEKKKFDQKEGMFVEYSERLSIHIPFIGISLIKSYPKPEELLFVSASETRIEVLQSVEQQKLFFQISSLQIDNQLRNAPYPVILSFDNEHGSISAGQMTKIDDRPKIKTDALMNITSDRTCEPIFYLAAAKWRKKEISLVSFEYISVRLAALRLELEEEVIVCLFDFVRTVILRMENRSMSWLNSQWPISATFHDSRSLDKNRDQMFSLNISRDQEGSRNNPLLPSVVPIGAPWQQIYLLARRQKKVYVEVFSLAPIKLTLSFSSAPWMHRNERLTSAESLGHISSTALQRGLIALADVEEAPVYLKQLTITHHMGSWESFQEILIRHYTRKLLHEMYKVFGSAGVFGNPMGFARNLGLGIKDFLSVPVRGVSQSPRGLFTGMIQGTNSLLSNTVYAISNATTQFSKSAHKSIVALTFDDQAVSKVEKQQKGLPSHSKGVLNEFLEGLTGFLQSPIRGAEKHGLPGVVSGIALGTAGLVARPVASILDVTGKTAQSIRNRSSLHRPSRFRVRIPRPLTRELPLQPYSWEEAIGTSMLLEADDAKFKDEIFLMCKALKQSGKFVIVTERLLLVVMCSSLVGLGTPEFRGVADPEWVIEVEMGLETVIHVDREVEVLNIVGSSPETLPKQQQNKRVTTRTNWRNHLSGIPLFQISIELAGEDQAEKVLQVLLSAIEQGNVRGWGIHFLHRSNLR